jgi:prepilin-type processing-associated H-X9-DG protein
MQHPRVQFSIRQLMIAVAILGVVWWVIGAVGGERAMAERERCRIAVSELARAVCEYQQLLGAFPPGTVAGGSMPPEQRLSWVTLVVRYQNPYLFDADRAWDDPENRLPRVRSMTVSGQEEMVSSMTPAELLPGLSCPANHFRLAAGLPYPVHYVGIAGVGMDAPTLPIGHPRSGVFGYDRPTRLADIKDGAATTLLLVETTFQNGPWTAGGPATVRGLDPARQPYFGRGHQFGGAHPGGTMVALADGSVRFLPETIAPKVFEALATIAGGETLPAGWDR